MGLIVYDDKTLLDAKNKVDTCNTNILEALEKIYNEFDSISSTLSTPKSIKSMPDIVMSLKSDVDFVKNSRDNYNRMFDTISNEYHDYYETVNRMVGGKNEK